MMYNNQAYEFEMQMTGNDRDSIYLDAISLNSDKNSIGFSRQSIYHSIQDLHFHEDVDNCINQQNSKNDRIWQRFQDGTTTVDYILAYNGSDKNQINSIKRQIYERNLANEGLKLEKEESQRIHFLKLHVPKDVLMRYAEIMKMRFPIKQVDEPDVSHDFHMVRSFKSILHKMFKFVRLDPRTFPPKKYELYHEYSRDKGYLFNLNDPNFFNNAVKSAIVNFILERTKYSEEPENLCLVGIERLLSESAYTAAYPLHDGSVRTLNSQRNLLFMEWAALGKWIKHQPLDNIKEYFGVKIALYFAWLGFYTHMLISASIVGLLCFSYGLFTMFSSNISDEICAADTTIMCPKCDQCDYWNLSETCVYSRIAHLFDNNLTIFFSIFMSIWATLYLELWKRYSANIVHRWGMTGYNLYAEHPRPAFLAKLKLKKRRTRHKLNLVTRTLEPTVPWQVKVSTYFLSYTIILLYILLALAAVFAVVIYKLSTMTSKRYYGENESMSYQIIIQLPITTGLINLLVITILNFFYDYLAVFLTDFEYRRTQTEYDESLSLKIYLFQFINYYSSIFYIAFLKGKFVGTPHKYNTIFKLRQEECAPGGCLMELCIQLAIIMIGKQAINSVLEILLPFLMKTYRSFSTKFGLSKEQKHNEDNEENLVTCNQWTADYKLLPWASMGLFEEYLEMIIQYGFVTLFVVAFPLAPLFALVNNIFEMRLDAKKFLQFYRRSIPRRVSDIGFWYNVMNVLGKISVITSALIIAFSSNFIPRMIYMATAHSDSGYVNFTLAYYNVSDFSELNKSIINTTFGNVTTCRYEEFRNPPDHSEPYKRPLIYWKILAARLAFVVIYQNLVSLVQLVVAWAIPDKPGRLSNLIKREEYLTSNIIIREEKLRALLQNMENKTEDVILSNGRAFYEAR